jgi:subtilisin family serine protease
VLLVGLTACQQDSPTDPAAAPPIAFAKESPTYIISLGATAPSDLAAEVARAGGTLKTHFKGAGVAVAVSDAADFATKLAAVTGVEAVGQDKVVEWVDPNMRVEPLVVGGVDETFFPIQWAPGAISAPQAWAAGAFGEGARVAVLDGGIFNTHPDLQANIDVARSASFVPGQAFNTDVGTFWHGTHVAGIVAAADNGLGVIGIAPKATIIGVKVLHSGSGSFESVIAGINYAATPIAEGGGGAHIINMSLGATFDRVDRDQTGLNETSDNSHLINALSKATSYARQRGVLVIASAGNNGLNLDGLGSIMTIPAMSVGALAISALAPEGWAKGMTNFDDLASYSNHGSSLITFGAPGGDARYPGNEDCTMSIVGGSITRPCWVFDLVLSTSRGTTASGNYSWAAGTSMAAPAVAGVAALVVGERGPMSPAALEHILQRSAEDLGKPGKDDVYGRGRINALRAIQ